MRVLALALLLAACATTPRQAADVGGCWVERVPRASTQAAFMRWTADANDPLLMHGELSPSRDAQPTHHFTLNEGERWRFCEAGENERCWQVARAQSGSLEGGRAFFDMNGRRLRIAVLEAGVERIVFNGVRDSCE